MRFPKDHVAVFRDSGMQKLPSLGGYGRENADGARFFEWQMLHAGAEAIRVCYVEDGEVLVEERLSLARD